MNLSDKMSSVARSQAKKLVRTQCAVTGFTAEDGRHSAATGIRLKVLQRANTVLQIRSFQHENLLLTKIDFGQ